MLVRRSPGSLAFLEARIALFGAGAILGMVGIWAEQGWLINVAIGVLLVGFALRFAKRSRPTEVDETEDDEP